MPLTSNQITGNLGEEIAVRFLVKHGYLIVLRNYRKKAGEIDIICKKRNILYFVEVKTVSRENITNESPDGYRPEDNIHSAKIKRIGRAVELYITEFSPKEDWEFLVVTVLLDKTSKKAKVSLITDLVL